MYSLFSLLSYLSLACAVIALWKPYLYPFKNPTKAKAAGLYFAAFIVFFVLGGEGKSEKAQQDSPVNSAATGAAVAPVVPGKALAWTEVARESTPMPANKRDRLQVAIIPMQDQATATDKELLATVTEAAKHFQKESNAPVVVVNLFCQQAENAFGELQLAQAVYIPDGKGFDGTVPDVKGVAAAETEWETLRVAKRGFTPKELEYMKLRAEMYKDYQSSTGIQDKELDAAISKKLGVPAGSLKPESNALKSVKADRL